MAATVTSPQTFPKRPTNVPQTSHQFSQTSQASHKRLKTSTGCVGACCGTRLVRVRIRYVQNALACNDTFPIWEPFPHTQACPCSLGVGRASTAHPAHSGAPSRPTSATGRRAYTHASAHLAPHAGNAPAACGSTTPHPRTAHARTSAAAPRGATVSSPPTHSSHPTLTFAQEERAAWRTPARYPPWSRRSLPWT